jgi:hypothetical protein
MGKLIGAIYFCYLALCYVAHDPLLSLVFVGYALMRASDFAKSEKPHG